MNAALVRVDKLEGVGGSMWAYALGGDSKYSLSTAVPILVAK